MDKKADGKLLSLGVDLGGTKIETALVDVTGHSLASHRCPTHADKGPDAVIAAVIACVENCLDKADGSVRCLGIGTAGQIDKDTGVVCFAPNLGWRNVSLRSRLEKSLGIAVVVSNDVRAATYGEWCYGIGQGINDMVCLFVGTGVGGGIISGGSLLEGCRNTAGELGHVTIVTNGRQCHCRNLGCLEAYVGGWAIAERAQEAVLAKPDDGQHLVELAGEIQQISATTVTKAYNNGDPLAQHLVEETVQYLAAGIVGIVNAINPCLIVLGGGVIQGLPEYASMAEQRVKSFALEAAIGDLRIVTAGLGDKAGVVGAAALAFHRTQQSEQKPRR